MAGPTPGRGLGLPVSVGVVGLVLIGLGQGVLNRQAIEDDLTSRSTQALRAAGLTGAAVSLSGRDATVTGVAADQTARAEDLVGAVDGIRVVRSSTPVGAETARPAAIPVGFTLTEGSVTVTGTVNTRAAATALIAAVRDVGQGWDVVDRLKVDTTLGTVEPIDSRLPAVTAMLGHAPVDGPKLVIQYNNGSVILRGTADGETEADLLAAAGETAETVVDGLDSPTEK